MLAAVVHGLQSVIGCSNEEWRQILAGVGLTPGQVSGEEALVPLEKGFAAFEAASAWSGRPTLGIDYAHTFAVGGTGPLGFALVNANDVRLAAQTLARFLPMVASMRFARFEEDERSGSIVWQYSGVERSPRLQFITFGVMAFILRLDDAVPQGWRPPNLILDCDPPPRMQPFEAALGPGLRFSRQVGHHRLSIEADLLGNPMPQANPRLYALMTRLAAIEQRQRGSYGSELENEARRLLPKLMREGRSGLKDLAAALEMSPAQLRLKLKQQHLDFRTLLDDVRRQTALLWLGEKDLSLTEIAFALGYSDSSVFTRACRKWFGQTPSEVRARARGG